MIGPNGAGKTTLFRMITKQEKPDSGTIEIGESVKLGYVDQSRDALDGKKNVWEEISGGHEMITLGKREVNSRAYTSAFNFKGADQQKKVGQLSGGERNRVHLAKMLKSGANVLLLDEPTNDLDVDTLRALEEALTDFAGCAVIISHDRFFLDRIATHMLAFEGDSHVEWFEGNFADYEEDKKRRLGLDSIIPHRLKYKKSWMAWLTASTCSLVVAVIATVWPWRWWASQLWARQSRWLSKLPGLIRPCCSYVSNTVGSPCRNCKVAVASHGLVKRCTVTSSWTRPLAHSSVNSPPRPTAWSWRGSPTSTIRQSPWSARRVSWWRLLVPIMPASSTTTLVPAGS